ncbi:spheniscin-1-like [Phaenicophaeus curvirostris]|uniref:spheniscin-1-like n=1 Tax=Phaenicophaeus curvirostris TaxID=33595 RepID=UPI0037F0BD0E
MKILYLLFSFFLLLLHGAAETVSFTSCVHRGGYCTFGHCTYPATPIGRCSALTTCCKSAWG